MGQRVSTSNVKSYVLIFNLQWINSTSPKEKKRKERIVKAHCSAKSHRRGSEAHVFHICLQALSRCQQNTVTSCVKSSLFEMIMVKMRAFIKSDYGKLWLPFNVLLLFAQYHPYRKNWFNCFLYLMDKGSKPEC